MAPLHDTLIPNAEDVALARQSATLLAGVEFREGAAVDVQVQGKKVQIPPALASLLVRALRKIAEGKSFAFIPVDEELSPQEAAEILNVSRPFAAKLFASGQIPSRKVGTHRRALAADVLSYKQKTEAERLKALEALAQQAQELNMGY